MIRTPTGVGTGCERKRRRGASHKSSMSAIRPSTPVASNSNISIASNGYLFMYIRNSCSLWLISWSVILAHFENRQKSFLRNLHSAQLFHALFAFFLFFQQLAL